MDSLVKDELIESAHVILDEIYLIKWTDLLHLSDRLTPLLLVEEQCRMSRFLRDEDQMRFLFGRSCLKLLVSSYLRKKPLELKLLANQYGKPYLEGEPCHFNVSHSGEWVAVAISKTPVGVDVETINGVNNWEEIASQFFTTSECETINSAITKNQKRSQFVKMWTYKESYIKALGVGLSRPLHSFSVDFSSGGQLAGYVSELSGETWEKNKWKIYPMNLDEQTMGAYASMTDVSFKLRRVDCQSLLNMVSFSQAI